ncbi:MAG: Gfo/Idh/MocA family oxidoreductase [Ilumatobacteraceae bacterium]|nr:Gfo/Idh/MocA family oxidoreductase [Ilumatobacteraceae bacterium]
MQPLNIAIAGSGAIAEAHLDAYLALGDLARVTTIVSSDPERGRALAARAPGARTVTDVADVIGDPAVDAVDVCGHTLAHGPVACAALDAGKDVLIEKPPAITLEAFDRIAEAAERSGRLVMVGQTVRFQPGMDAIITAVDAGEIGEVSMVHITWYVAHVWPRAWRGWQLDEASSGGHLIHNGMHSIDLALRLLDDEPASVFTRGWKTYSPDVPTPDSFHVLIRGRRGTLAVLETSYGLRPPADPVRRIVAAGALGTLSHSTTDETELVNPTVADTPSSTVGAMTAEIRTWLLAVRGEIESPIPLAHSRIALAGAIAAQRSYDTGQPVDLEPTGPTGGAR